jgi:hypothetical protein
MASFRSCAPGAQKQRVRQVCRSMRSQPMAVPFLDAWLMEPAKTESETQRPAAL